MNQTFSSRHSSFTAQELLEETQSKDIGARLNPLYYIRLQEAVNEER